MRTEGDRLGQDEPAAPLVTGRLVLTAEAPALRGATAHVHLEDISYADAAAAVVADARIPDVSHEPSHGDTVLPFALYAVSGTVVDPSHDYAVRVWVDRDGDGRAGPDDLHSHTSHRVLTGGFGRSVTITLGAP